MKHTRKAKPVKAWAVISHSGKFIMANDGTNDYAVARTRLDLWPRGKQRIARVIIKEI